MQATHSTTLTAANDNPVGATQTALIGLVTLLARAEVRRAANINAAPTVPTKEATQ